MEFASLEESKQVEEFFQKKHYPPRGKWFWLGLTAPRGNEKWGRGYYPLLEKRQRHSFSIVQTIV